MKIVPLKGTLLQRANEEYQLSQTAKLEAEQQYNIMMGTYIDPSETEEENEDVSDV